jgi:hypothetical protein
MMDERYVPAPMQHLFGFSYKQIIEALRLYITKKGYPIKSGKTYVIGLDRTGGEEQDTMLALVVTAMPNGFMKPCSTSRLSTVRPVEPSTRAGFDQQKFEITQNGVKEAMVSFCESFRGRKIPEGPITLWGIDDPMELGSPNGYGHRQPAPALTLYVDPT